MKEYTPADKHKKGITRRELGPFALGATVVVSGLTEANAEEQRIQEPAEWSSIVPDEVHGKMGEWVLVDDLMQQDIPTPIPFDFLPNGTGLIVSKRFHRFWLFKNGQLVGDSGPVGTARTSEVDPETGEPYFTPEGTFKIERQEGAEYMSRQYPDQTDEPNMPHSSFFFRGVATHGSKNFHLVDGVLFLHLDSSHGCVNVLTEAAQMINQTLAIGDTVVVLP